MTSRSSIEQVTLNLGNSTFNTDSSTLRYTFDQQTSLFNKEIAVSFISVPYSWRNVTAAQGNNTFSYDFPNGAGFDTVNVTVPDGFYEIDELSAYMQFVMKQNNHYLIDSSGLTPVDVYYASWRSNAIYYTTTFTLTPVPTAAQAAAASLAQPAGATWAFPAAATTPVLNFANEEFNKLLGLTINYQAPTGGSAAVLTEQNGDLVPFISPTTSINIDCNMVNNTIQNNQTLFSFSPTVGYGSNIVYNTPYPLFYRLVDGGYSEITMTFRDQRGSLITIVDPDIQIGVVIQDRAHANRDEVKTAT